MLKVSLARECSFRRISSYVPSSSAAGFLSSTRMQHQNPSLVESISPHHDPQRNREDGRDHQYLGSHAGVKRCRHGPVELEPRHARQTLSARPFPVFGFGRLGRGRAGMANSERGRALSESFGKAQDRLRELRSPRTCPVRRRRIRRGGAGYPKACLEPRRRSHARAQMVLGPFAVTKGPRAPRRNPATQILDSVERE